MVGLKKTNLCLRFELSSLHSAGLATLYIFVKKMRSPPFQIKCIQLLTYTHINTQVSQRFIILLDTVRGTYFYFDFFTVRSYYCWLCKRRC